MKFIAGPFFFAFLAAVGNSLYVYSQRKTSVGANPFLFSTLFLTVCVVLCLGSYFVLGTRGSLPLIKSNAGWVLLGGFGIYILYIGFYVLYSKYGASYYTLYAMASVLTTSVVVGCFLFRERFNLYSGLSIVCALASILFFGLSRK
jgi:drug/metabolite transporter (DMT)-like permease